MHENKLNSIMLIESSTFTEGAGKQKSSIKIIRNGNSEEVQRKWKHHIVHFVRKDKENVDYTTFEEGNEDTISTSF